MWALLALLAILLVSWAGHRRTVASYITARLEGFDYRGSRGVVFQRSEVTCGVAALDMVLRALGADTTEVDSLRRLVMARGRGTSVGELVRAARSAGLQARGWVLPERALARAPVPFIAYMGGHFVVVDSVGPEYVHWRDPAIGRLRADLKKFNRAFTGRALLFHPPSGDSVGSGLAGGVVEAPRRPVR